MASWVLNENIFYEGVRTGCFESSNFSGEVEFMPSELYDPKEDEYLCMDLNKWHEYWQKDEFSYISDDPNDWRDDIYQIEKLNQIHEIRERFKRTGQIKCPVLERGDGTRVGYQKGRCTTKVMLELGLNIAFFVVPKKRIKILVSNGLL